MNMLDHLAPENYELAPCVTGFNVKLWCEEPVLYRKGKRLTLPHQKVELKVPPKGFKPVHEQAIHIITNLMRTVAAMKNRAIPVTRAEVLRKGVSKQIVKELVSMGYVREALTPLLRKDDRKNTGSQSILCFTAQGFQYANALFKMNLVGEKNDAADGHADESAGRGASAEQGDTPEQGADSGRVAEAGDGVQPEVQ